MSEGGFIAFAHCWSCSFGFTFDPDLVPSIPIDPQTNLPLDIEPSPDGLEAARARAVKQPICASCMAASNAKRRREGREEIHIFRGAYPYVD